MNIEELERTIALTKATIKKTSSYKLKNDLTKYLHRLTKEKNDYYKFRKEKNQ